MKVNGKLCYLLRDCEKSVRKRHQSAFLLESQVLRSLSGLFGGTGVSDCVLGSTENRISGCVSSEGWHVQQEKGLPGQESEAP